MKSYKEVFTIIVSDNVRGYTKLSPVLSSTAPPTCWLTSQIGFMLH